MPGFNAIRSLQETEGFHKIRSMAVTDGFLDGLKIEFTDHLNVLIGTRGSGKTTLLEFLRFALGLDSPDGASGLVRENLAHGRVTLEIETKNGTPYTVERAWGADPQVFDAAGEAVPIEISRGVLFGADVYGQSEIEEIATEPLPRRRLIDRFVQEELRVIDVGLQTLERKLRRSRQELLVVLQDLDSLPVEELSSKKQELLVKLETLNEAGSNTVEFRTALSERQEREKEARGVEAAEQELTSLDDGFRSLARDATARLGALLPPASLSGPNSGTIVEVAKELEQLGEALAQQLSSAGALIAKAQERVAAAKAEISGLHAKQEAAYTELMKKHEAARVAQLERSELQAMQSEVEGLLQRRAGKERVLREKEAEWKELVKELVALRQERANLRAAAVDYLNSKLEGTHVRVALKEGADSTEFRDRLDQSLAKARPRLGKRAAVVACLAQDTPRRLVDRIRRQAYRELEEKGLSAHQAKRVIEVLDCTEDLFWIETADLLEVAEISFREKGTWKPSDKLSTGQKSSAVLPILLQNSSRPLITDEIESHLDQETLLESVIEQARKMRGRRQLIFATHNANVPVSGDDGDTRVFVLDSDGDRAAIVQVGSVDETKDNILKLLEGGEPAFERRRKRYGITPAKKAKKKAKKQ
tara:strand:- start:2031 stop:3974 length:1944 start_codon:yes stop_codon:yes gene_type:complete